MCSQNACLLSMDSHVSFQSRVPKWGQINFSLTQNIYTLHGSYCRKFNHRGLLNGLAVPRDRTHIADSSCQPGSHPVDPVTVMELLFGQIPYQHLKFCQVFFAEETRIWMFTCLEMMYSVNLSDNEPYTVIIPRRLHTKNRKTLLWAFHQNFIH